MLTDVNAPEGVPLPSEWRTQVERRARRTMVAITVKGHPDAGTGLTAPVDDEELSLLMWSFRSEIIPLYLVRCYPKAPCCGGM